MTPRQQEMAEKINRNPRKAGGLCLLLGGGLLYEGVIKPIQDAQQGAEHVSISTKMAICAVIGLVLGLALLIGGGRVARITHPAPGESRAVAIVLAVIVFGLGLAMYFGMKSYITSLGYTF